MAITIQAAASDNAALVAAVIAAMTSVVVAVIGATVSAMSSRAARRSATAAERSLEELKTELTEQSAERNARRDYEYEARKRLYDVCEPVLFQLTERSADAYHRILDLAEACRDGDVRRDGGWLVPRYQYYPMSTLHKFLTPIVLFRVLQQNLTIVDLTLDRSISMRYTLGKLLGLSLTDAFEFARMASLPYGLDAQVSRPERPGVEWRQGQGLATGLLEKATEAMTIRTSEGRALPMSYGEFSERYSDETSGLRARLSRRR